MDKNRKINGNVIVKWKLIRYFGNVHKDVSDRLTDNARLKESHRK